MQLISKTSTSFQQRQRPVHAWTTTQWALHWQSVVSGVNLLYPCGGKCWQNILNQIHNDPRYCTSLPKILSLFLLESRLYLFVVETSTHRELWQQSSSSCLRCLQIKIDTLKQCLFMKIMVLTNWRDGFWNCWALLASKLMGFSYFATLKKISHTSQVYILLPLFHWRLKKRSDQQNGGKSTVLMKT